MFNDINVNFSTCPAAASCNSCSRPTEALCSSGRAESSWQVVEDQKQLQSGSSGCCFLSWSGPVRSGPTQPGLSSAPLHTTQWLQWNVMTRFGQRSAFSGQRPTLDVCNGSGASGAWLEGVARQICQPINPCTFQPHTDDSPVSPDRCTGVTGSTGWSLQNLNMSRISVRFSVSLSIRNPTFTVDYWHFLWRTIQYIST